jgi:hypothetical protein
MVDSTVDPERLKRLRSEFHSQTAKISWTDLQPQFARGLVVEVVAGLDLVDVAIQMTLDNTRQFQSWFDEAKVIRVADQRAEELLACDAMLWAVVAPPWVLVQKI